jgi:mRNA-degrading endonuclease RelE of RelBE toxin-antitoxin system
MSQWSLDFLPEAQANLSDFDLAQRQKILIKLRWLVENFDSITPTSLRGEFKEFFKLRVGDIRIFYKINWQIDKIIVCHIAKRDKAYQRN